MSRSMTHRAQRDEILFNIVSESAARAAWWTCRSWDVSQSWQRHSLRASNSRESRRYSSGSAAATGPGSREE